MALEKEAVVRDGLRRQELPVRADHGVSVDAAGGQRVPDRARGGVVQLQQRPEQRLRRHEPVAVGVGHAVHRMVADRSRVLIQRRRLLRNPADDGEQVSGPVTVVLAVHRAVRDAEVLEQLPRLAVAAPSEEDPDQHVQRADRRIGQRGLGPQDSAGPRPVQRRLRRPF